MSSALQLRVKVTFSENLTDFLMSCRLPAIVLRHTSAPSWILVFRFFLFYASCYYRNDFPRVVLAGFCGYFALVCSTLEIGRVSKGILAG